MSTWICCNACFHPPSAERQLAVTTCGHIICSACFRKGKQGECIICKAKCDVAALSDKSSSEVKALFMDISTVATKHFTEISKVLMFQARHSKRLLCHYQERNQKLEEVLVKMKQDMQQKMHEMQQMSKTLSEQSAYIAKLESVLQQHQSAKKSPSSSSQINISSHTLGGQFSFSAKKSPSSSSQINISSHTLGGQNSVLQIPFNSPVSTMGLLRSSGSSLRSGDSMEVDGRNNPFRKPDPVPRLSLISPPKDGRMGTIPQRPTGQNTRLGHAARSASVSRFQSMPNTPELSNGGRSGWNSPVYKPILAYKFASMSNLVCPKP